MSKYPAIPEFMDAETMANTVRAMKEIVEQMAGQRSGVNSGAPSVFVLQVEPTSLLSPTHKLGDFWIKPGPPPELWFWSGAEWTKVAP